MDDSQAELEKPAKNYQVKSLQKDVQQNNKLVETVILKLEDIQKNQATTAYVDKAIKDSEARTDGKYGPFLSNAKWAAKTAITTCITIILFVIGIYLKS